MSTREVTAIAIKILAIWLLVNVILYIPNLVLVFANLQNFNQQEIPQSVFYALVGASLVIGFFSAFLLMRTANSVLGATNPSPANESGINQAFVLQVAGVYFIVSALAGLPAIFLSLSKVSTVKIETIFYIGGKLLELASGLYLLIKPNLWVQWLNKLRGSG